MMLRCKQQKTGFSHPKRGQTLLSDSETHQSLQKLARLRNAQMLFMY